MLDLAWLSHTWCKLSVWTKFLSLFFPHSNHWSQRVYTLHNPLLGVNGLKDSIFSLQMRLILSYQNTRKLCSAGYSFLLLSSTFLYIQYCDIPPLYCLGPLECNGKDYCKLFQLWMQSPPQNVSHNVSPMHIVISRRLNYRVMQGIYLCPVIHIFYCQMKKGAAQTLFSNSSEFDKYDYFLCMI